MTEDLTARTISITGHGGDEIEAYLALPDDGSSSRGSVVVIHHMPGYDSSTKEIVRKFAAYGYPALMPNLYFRDAPGASPDDAAATARAKGGVPDERLVGDVAGAAEYLRALPGSNGKVGVIGYCSGGRQSFLAACSLQLDAAVDCYGACIVNPPPEGMPLRVAPIVGLAGDLSCPLLGLFGADDKYPAPEETAELSKVLDELGKPHEFHTYEGAGHAFFTVDRPAFRPEAAKDGWQKIWDFYGQYLAG
ncbi:MAG TPA: dienelactone hydrolase family protein [Streptosporangiaceae bacterium]|nr:dienelactone hydrolase family protein [Streptosporangiaceae bacterium]